MAKKSNITDIINEGMGIVQNIFWPSTSGGKKTASKGTTLSAQPVATKSEIKPEPKDEIIYSYPDRTRNNLYDYISDSASNVAKVGARYLYDYLYPTVQSQQGPTGTYITRAIQPVMQVVADWDTTDQRNNYPKINPIPVAKNPDKPLEQIVEKPTEKTAELIKGTIKIAEKIAEKPAPQDEETKYSYEHHYEYGPTKWYPVKTANDYGAGVAHQFGGIRTKSLYGHPTVNITTTKTKIKVPKKSKSTEESKEKKTFGGQETYDPEKGWEKAP